MSYLDCIKVCNYWNRDDFIPFHVADNRLGWIKTDFARHLVAFPEVFDVAGSGVSLQPMLNTFDARSEAVHKAIEELVRQGVMPPLHGEKYPVGRQWGQPELLIDREAAAWFGIRAYGQHINGFVRDGDRLSMWIGRRAKDKRNFPGKLDHLAAGGLPFGIDLLENVQKECWEEAGMPAEISRTAYPVGALTYCRQTGAGLKPDTIFCYDLALSKDFYPQCTDGEVETFYLMDVEEVRDRVCNSEEFKPNCSLVIIDFLIRHGRIDPDTPAYLDIIQALHPELP